MKKIITNRRLSNKKDFVKEFMTVEQEVNKLPQLSAVEKVDFDHSVDINHLYYSSKIEGSHLDDKRLNKAIHA